MLTKDEWIQLGQQIGSVVAEKNKAYGDSVRKTARIMAILFPDVPITNGLEPEKDTDQ